MNIILNSIIILSEAYYFEKFIEAHFIDYDPNNKTNDFDQRTFLSNYQFICFILLLTFLPQIMLLTQPCISYV